MASFTNDMRRPFGIAAIVLVAVALPNASATLPGRNGIIVFKRYFEPDQWGALFTIGSNGRDEKQLTHPSRNVTDDQPDWSPDASLIVFTRCSPDAPCTIYTVKPDGSQLKRVSPKPCLPGPPQCEDGANASFLRDGRRVVYTRATGGERHFPNWDQIQHSDIVVRDLDGGNARVRDAQAALAEAQQSAPARSGALRAKGAGNGAGAFGNPFEPP